MPRIPPCLQKKKVFCEQGCLSAQDLLLSGKTCPMFCSSNPDSRHYESSLPVLAQDPLLSGSARPAPAAALPTEFDDGGEHVERPRAGDAPRGARRFSEKHASDDGGPPAPVAAGAVRGSAVPPAHQV